jgi:hypothetical protein
MKSKILKNIFFIFCYLIWVDLFAQNNSNIFFINPSKSDSISQCLKGTKPIAHDKQIYFVYLNMSDCSNCHNSTYFLSSLDTNTSKVIILINDINIAQKDAFIKNFNLSKEFFYIQNDWLHKTLSDYYKKGKSRSWIIRLTENVLESMEFRAFKGIESFSSFNIPFSNSVNLDNSSVFYSGISKATYKDNNLYAIEYPKTQLLVFNKEGKCKLPRPLDSLQLKFAFESILDYQPDSIKAKNSFGESIEFYNSRLKYMGFKQVSYHNIIKFDNRVYAIGYISFPIENSNSNYRNTGINFIMEILLTDSNFIISNLTPIEPFRGIKNQYLFAANYLYIDKDKLKIGLTYSIADSILKKQADNKVKLDISYSKSNNHFHVDNKYTQKNDLIPLSSFTCFADQQNLSLIRNNIDSTGGDWSYFKFSPKLLHENSHQLFSINYFDTSVCDNYSNYYTFYNNKLMYSIIRYYREYYLVKFNPLNEVIFEAKKITLTDGQIDLIISDGQKLFFLIQAKDKTYKFNSSELTNLLF